MKTVFTLLYLLHFFGADFPINITIKSEIPFSIVRMPGKSSNIPYGIVYSAIGAESLRIARANNNP